MNRVQLPQAGRTIEVEPSQTILVAALQAGVRYPHGCRSGRCGSCKSRLIDGSVDLLPHTRVAAAATEIDRDPLSTATTALSASGIPRRLTIARRPCATNGAAPSAALVRSSARMPTEYSPLVRMDQLWAQRATGKSDGF